MSNDQKLPLTPEARTLSARETFFWKWIFAPIWIIGFGLGTLFAWNEGNFLEDRSLFAGAWVFGTTMLLWMVAGLKRVRVDATRLWISNYRREIVVPLSDVTAIKQIWFISSPQAVVHLRRDDGFGDKIRFMLRSRFYFPWRGHPDVVWLREVAEKAGGLR